MAAPFELLPTRSRRRCAVRGMRAHLPIGIEMVYNCVIVGITLKRGVSKMGQIKGGFLRCGSAIASSIALMRSEEHTSELQSLMRISYAVFCLKTTKNRYSTQLRTSQSTPRNTSRISRPQKSQHD